MGIVIKQLETMGTAAKHQFYARKNERVGTKKI